MTIWWLFSGDSTNDGQGMLNPRAAVTESPQQVVLLPRNEYYYPRTLIFPISPQHREEWSLFERWGIQSKSSLDSLEENYRRPAAGQRTA